jgi:hypothetical protein
MRRRRRHLPPPLRPRRLPPQRPRRRRVLHPTPTTPPSEVTLKDSMGDMVDENDKHALGEGYQDITKVTVAARNGHVALDMWLAQPVPPLGRDPQYEAISFIWWLDTNGDGGPDYQVFVENTDARQEMTSFGWDAGLFSYAANYNWGGQDFPGTLHVDGDHVTVTLDFGVIGSPDRISAGAETESDILEDPINHPLNDVLRHDYAPNDSWPNGKGSIVVSVEN